MELLNLGIDMVGGVMDIGKTFGSLILHLYLRNIVYCTVACYASSALFLVDELSLTSYLFMLHFLGEVLLGLFGLHTLTKHGQKVTDTMNDCQESVDLLRIRIAQNKRSVLNQDVVDAKLKVHPDRRARGARDTAGMPLCSCTR